MLKKITLLFIMNKTKKNPLLLLMFLTLIVLSPQLKAQPSIAISSSPVYANAVAAGSSNVILQKINLAVTLAPATFTGLTINTAGTYGSSDVSNMKVRYSLDATLDAGDATLSTYSSPGAAGTKVFPSFSITTISAGSAATIFVTADIAGGAVVGNTVNITTTSFSNISFVSGTKTGINPLPAGGSKNFCTSVPSAPIVTGSTIVSCGSFTTLTSSAGPNTSWFDAPSGGTLLAIGNSITTDFLSGPTLFYAQDGIVSSGTATFSYTGSAQTFTVPAGVTSIDIDARGGQGGTAGGNTGGLGARMQGTFAVTPGQVLTVVVGAVGVTSYNSGSGGGGTGVINGVIPMIIAGGGGGASSVTPENGGPGLTSTTGGSSSGPGGTAGSGGQKGYFSGDCGWAAGGGGFSGDGYGGADGSDGGPLPGVLGSLGGARSWLNGGAGGVNGGCYFTYPNVGVFGCGGGGCGSYGGGGGGGYSGGGGGQYRYSSGSGLAAGAGGGSYNIGTYPVNTAGYQTGNGQVIITYSSITCPSERTAVLVSISGSPVASSDTTIMTCHSANLTAVANTVTDVLEWFDAPIGGTLLHTGSSYTTPSLNINTTYYVQNRTPAVASVTSTYNYSGSMTSYTVPAGVTALTIEAYGAQGNSATGGAYIGGLGARMLGTFAVTPGDQFILLVGQQGLAPDGVNGGGGGGSFVVKVDPLSSDIISSGAFAGTHVTPVLIAGGGGGTRTAAAQNGNPGSMDATLASGASSTGGGGPSSTTLGNGGIASSPSWGSAGAGFRTNGGDDAGWGYGGSSFLNGGAGGIQACGSGSTQYGGFGGGGSGGGCYGGGGGGGYTGGDGGYIAGGGGSFNSGGSGSSGTSGVRSGDGLITITIPAVEACTSSREAINVNVVQISSPSVTDGVRCGNGSVAITATPTLGGETIDWYADSIGGAVLSGGLGTTTFNTPSISITTIYFAQVRNIATGCISPTRTRVTATIIPTSATSSSQTICSNQLVLFNGILRNTSGTYLDTFTNARGCDSIVTLNLTVLATSTGFITQTICGGTSYFFNGVNLTVTGPYLDTFANSVGCDSVLTLNLFVSALSNGLINQTICNGTTYLFNGVNLGVGGAYKDTLANIAGCDSIVTLNLTISPASTGTITTTIATGSSYLFNGVNLTQPGVYKDTLANVSGCDSVVTLNLSVGTAIANIKEATWEMSIYPNPAMSNATVSYTLPTEATILDIILVDAQGKVMMADKVNQPKITGTYPLNLKGIASGLYFVRLTANGYSETRRIVVNKD